MRSFLVTGGCGFIGRHLCRALYDMGARIRVLDNLSAGRNEPVLSGCDVIIGDVRDIAALDAAMQDIDGCFHLAAISSVDLAGIDWVESHVVNLTGALNVFEASRRRNPPVPVVYASSAAVYGDAVIAPSTETSRACPISAYGADKLGVETHARILSSMFLLPLVGMRLFNVFGPEQEAGVVTNFIRGCLRGDSLVVFGEGNHIRDFVYIDDVVAFMLDSMNMLLAEPQLIRGEVFNICSGTPTSIAELAHHINSLVSGSVQITYKARRSADILVSHGDPRKAHQVFGRKAIVSLREGLFRTVKAVR